MNSSVFGDLFRNFIGREFFSIKCREYWTRQFTKRARRQQLLAGQTTSHWSPSCEQLEARVVMAASSTQRVARYTFDVSPGLYQIHSSYLAINIARSGGTIQSLMSGTVPDTVKSSESVLATLSVDQRIRPTSLVENGVGFAQIGGVYTVTADGHDRRQCQRRRSRHNAEDRRTVRYESRLHRHVVRL